MIKKVKIIGAGLAGCEAAYQLSKRGVETELYEMRPKRMTPAHRTGNFAELVCSNSLKSEDVETSSGLLKEELRIMDSLILKCADKTRVPAGSSLSVDREGFSLKVKEELLKRDIKIICEEVKDIDGESIWIVASGPLTSEPLTRSIERLTGKNTLYFFDAAAPIVAADSIDTDNAFFASRYGKGEADDYLNCPMNKEQYSAFYEALVSADCSPVKDFEGSEVFSGCMPVEVMAKRGFDAIRFGPMKPVGLYDKNNVRPYAVVQLRKENREATMYNLVGFQTHLTFGEQKRVFSMIPALKNAEFLRYGVMHRNSFVNAPAILTNTFALKTGERKNIFIAGQLSGVEGYVESAMSGLVASINAANTLMNKPPFILPATTISGALSKYISESDSRYFQPMNGNYGLLPPIEIKDKKLRKSAYAERALNDLKVMLTEGRN
ncbi:MAG: methylenetetrahydrofolate--tRNA-(uracil(54)-C(5))-methyltransferase (FADH(2)-oxidizing) TrmFO [Clostridiales bacterium]|jgi:methylenetetrahydrofolate--tRNA-(uracil-5-)-methyltransferase|nr:methylenetetrahydrofolate--tRNA-(uracil(54)-C(5))-methyltransferase (FADH(2)-oxidizing) TrmFO [Clostridiales bacterium]